MELYAFHVYMHGSIEHGVIRMKMSRLSSQPDQVLADFLTGARVYVTSLFTSVSLHLPRVHASHSHTTNISIDNSEYIGLIKDKRSLDSSHT